MKSKSTTPRRLQLAVALALSAAATVSVNAADDFSWNLAGPSDWNIPGNWTNINIGTGNNDRFINNGGIAEITANTVLPIRDMKIGLGGGTSGTVNHRMGLHSTGGSWTFIGNGGGNGTYNVAETTIPAGGLTGFATGSGSEITGQFRMGEGAGSTARLNVNTTGSIAASGDFYVGTNGGATSVSTMNLEKGAVSSAGFVRIGADSKGTLNMSGGSLASAGELWVGQGGTGDGTVNQTGGAVTSSSWLAIGRGGSVGNYNLSGTGSLAHTGPNKTIIGSVDGKGTLTQTGGTFSESNDLRLGEGAPAVGIYNLSAGTATINGWVGIGWTGGGKGTITVSGTGLLSVANQHVEIGGADGGTGNGTLNLDGGTVLTNTITRVVAGTAQLNFNGGVFKAASNQGEFLPNFNTATTEVKIGGAVIDSNGFAITTGDALDGVGGLTKQGLGSLTLTGANIYTGPTLVDNGTLALTGTGSIATSPLIVVKQPGTLDVSGVGGGFNLVSGQTLKGKGTVIGNVNDLPGSVLALGESVGTLTFANNLDISLQVAAAATASLFFELDTPGASDLALLTGGILNIGAGGLEFDDFAFTALGGFGPGTYTLFDTSNLVAGSLGTSVTGTIAGNGATLFISGDGQDVQLNVVPEPSALLSLVGGVAMLVGFQRRRRA